MVRSWVFGAHSKSQIFQYFHSGERVRDLADFGIEFMNAPQEKQSSPEPSQTAEPAPQPEAHKPPREIGGRDGPDPTRFGDWEKSGRCIDF
jgi:hypothetical protein